MQQLAHIIDLSANPIGDAAFQVRCKATLDRAGALVLPGFLTAAALATVRLEGAEHSPAAFYAASKHNVYLKPQDDALPSYHPRNRLVVSSKGCITDEDIPVQSPLRTLYDAQSFRIFSVRYCKNSSCTLTPIGCLQSICTMLIAGRSWAGILTIRLLPSRC